MVYYGTSEVSGWSGFVRSLRSIKSLRSVMTLRALVVWGKWVC